MKSALKPVIDSMTTAVVVLDSKLCIEYLNPAAEGLLTTSLSHAVGRSVKDLILLEDRILSALETALSQDQPFTEREATLRLPDNISELVDFTVNILDEESARPQPRLLLELQHLSRLKRINKDDDSVARQETTRHLIRGLAHEIKNPLGGIRGAAQLLEAELPDPDLKEYTGVIISETDRLKDLVDRMLGPQRQLEQIPVNILEVLEHVIAVTEAEDPGRIHWERDYDPSLPDIQGDRTQLVQAVMNIVRNACDALKSIDSQRIALKSRGIRQFTIGSTLYRLVLLLEISDNGPGIDPEMQERIFFPMISGRPEGTGLGLAITQNIISQHGGSVQVTSRPGQTSFSIYIPFTDRETKTNSQQDGFET